MLDPHQASTFLSYYKMTKLGSFRRVVVSTQQLANWRTNGTGPAYYKEDGRVYYNIEELKKFRDKKLRE